MKNVKKLMSLLMVIVVFLHSGTIFAAVSAKNICKEFGLINGDTIDDEKYTRGMCAKTLSKIYNDWQEIDAIDTEFDDVKKDDPNSGYINYVALNGLMTGTDESSFSPNAPIVLEEMLKPLIDFAGYADLAKTIGYSKLAIQLGLLNGVISDIKNEITVQSAQKLVSNFLTLSGPKPQIEQGKVTYTGQEMVVMEKMGLQAYKADAVCVDAERISLKITEEVFDKQDSDYAIGATDTFDVSNHIDTHFFDGVPVIAWICNGAVVYMELQNNVEVRYEYIYSINNDINEDSEYLVDYINNIVTYSDKKYKAASSMKVFIDGEQKNNSVQLIGKFVKIVSIDKDIIRLETWSFGNACVITEVDQYYNIAYKSVGIKSGYLDNVLDYASVQIFINGEKVSIKELKKDSLFYYYENDDESELVICVSETRLDDIVSGIGQAEVSVGNNSFDIDEQQLYLAYGAGTMKLYSQELARKIVGTVSQVYVDGKGYARIILSDVENNEFIGVLIKEWTNEDEEKSFFRIVHAEDDFSTEEYELSKKIKIEVPGKSLDDIKNTANAFDENALYKFRINNRGQIKNVSSMKPFCGTLEESRFNINHYHASAKPLLEVQSNSWNHNTDAKKVFLNPNTMLNMYINDHGEKCIRKIAWSELRDKNNYVNGTYNRTVVLYKDDQSLAPWTMFVGGKEITPSTIGYAIATRKIEQYNEETEEIETIVDFIVHHKNTGNVQVTCSVSNEDAVKIKIPSVEMINYDVQDEKGRAVLAEDEVFDLSGEFSEWPLVYGTVDDIDSFGIKLTNGMFYSFDQRFDTTAYKVEGKKIVKGDMKKIIPGKRVQLYNAEQSCTFLFYEE